MTFFIITTQSLEGRGKEISIFPTLFLVGKYSSFDVHLPVYFIPRPTWGEGQGEGKREKINTTTPSPLGSLPT